MLRRWRQYKNECVISTHVHQERMQTISLILTRLSKLPCVCIFFQRDYNKEKIIYENYIVHYIHNRTQTSSNVLGTENNIDINVNS